MAPPTWVVGQVLTAADVNNWFVPLCVTKLSDQSKTSNTTIAADTELFLPVAVSATYWFTFSIDFEGGTQNASDIKFNWTVPAGTTLRYHSVREGLVAGTANVVNCQTGTDVVAAGTKGAGNLCGTSGWGTLLTAGTAGNITFQWAQNTSSATATIVHAQSVLMLQRVSLPS